MALGDFGSDHYVPVLKCKRGEKQALATLSSTVRASLTPLVEVVEMSSGTVDSHIEKSLKGLAAAVGPQGCFLDARELAPQGAAAAKRLFAEATSDGVVFVPVTGISGRIDTAAAVAHRTNGIAVRLTRDDFEAGSVGSQVPAFLAAHSLKDSEVDLIVDLGTIEDLVPTGAVRLARLFLASIPSHGTWRTLTLVASSFPKSMRIVPQHSNLKVDRVEWLAWTRLRSQLPSGSRIPTYGDCAIQHPVGVEGFDPRIMQVAAAVRYAIGDKWLLVKGESTKRVLPSVQFPSLARQLTSGSLAHHYQGPAHCRGCHEAAEAAAGKPGRGSAEVWRRIGTSHHLTVVTEQIAALPAP